MTKTSWQVIDRYQRKAYDRIFLKVEKGQKQKIQKQAIAQKKSLNKYITDLINQDMEKSNPAFCKNAPLSQGIQPKL